MLNNVFISGSAIFPYTGPFNKILFHSIIRVYLYFINRILSILMQFYIRSTNLIRFNLNLYLAMASIFGRPGCPFMSWLSCRGKPCGGSPGLIMAPGWWFICMNCMWFKCVGGGLYPFARSGDFSNLEISTKRDKQHMLIEFRIFRRAIITMHIA